MKLYLWEIESNLTTNYHPTGSAVAIAPDKKSAVALVRALESVDPAWKPGKPTVFSLATTPKLRAWLFPNAGCC